MSQNHLKGGPIPNVMEWEEPLEFSDVLTLSSNLKEAMEMMLQIDEIEKEFPGLDCGACGAPTAAPLPRTWSRASARIRSASLSTATG